MLRRRCLQGFDLHTLCNGGLRQEVKGIGDVFEAAVDALGQFRVNGVAPLPHTVYQGVGHSLLLRSHTPVSFV